MDDKQREELIERIAGLDTAIQAIEKARKPFDEAMYAVIMVKDELLERHEAEIAGTCEGCSHTVLNGEKGYRCSEGEILCRACAPTYRDEKKELENAREADDGDPDEIQGSLSAIEAHVKGGGSLDDKHVFPL